MKRAILVGGGPVNKDFLLRELEADYDLLLAIDGGGKALFDLGYLPEKIIGDFDSLPAKEEDYFRTQGVEFYSYLPEKDWTDLELGLELAAKEGIREILIFGALGGRLDHTVANLALLYKSKLAGMEILLVGQDQLVTIIGQQEEVLLMPFTGGHFSLLSYGCETKGVRIFAAKYPLEGATIESGSTLGVHNEFLAEPVRISLDSGYLLLIVEGLKHWSGGQEIYQRLPLL